MRQQMVGKVFLSLAVRLSAIVATIVDPLPGDNGHFHNPQWPAHAIFHDIVMFLLLDCVQRQLFFPDSDNKKSRSDRILGDVNGGVNDN